MAPGKGTGHCLQSHAQSCSRSHRWPMLKWMGPKAKQKKGTNVRNSIGNQVRKGAGRVTGSPSLCKCVTLSKSTCNKNCSRKRWQTSSCVHSGTCDLAGRTGPLHPAIERRWGYCHVQACLSLVGSQEWPCCKQMGKKNGVGRVHTLAHTGQSIRMNGSVLFPWLPNTFSESAKYFGGCAPPKKDGTLFLFKMRYSAINGI